MWALNGFDIKMMEKNISFEKILIMGPFQIYQQLLEKQSSPIPLRGPDWLCSNQVVNKKTLNFGKNSNDITFHHHFYAKTIRDLSAPIFSSIIFCLQLVWRGLIKNFKTYFPSVGGSDRIRVRAAAASSKAQETLEVSRFST